MRPYNFTTVTTTPALTLIHGEAVALLGLTATNAEAAIYYLKFWWGGNKATELPVIGTTVPSLTIAIPVGGLIPCEFNHPLQGGGPCWVAATLNAVYSDDSALATGGDIVTLFID